MRHKKGSITIFLALILSLFLALVGTSLQSVQMAAARAQILSGLDIGLYSLFGQYDRLLLKEYDLFFLDGAAGGGNLDLGAVYTNLESYMKPVLKQNSQKLKIKQGGFTGYRLATDENGEVFYRQVLAYMKDTLGVQGVNLLLNRLENKESAVRSAEESGQKAEQGDAMENYESEMDSASRKSQEAAAEQESQGNGGFGDGESPESFPAAEQKTEVVNPIPILKRIRRMSLLDLVVPVSTGISDGRVDKSELLSGRSPETGMSMPGGESEDSSKSSQMLFQQYLSDHLGSYMEPASGALKYQMEYLLGGENNDRDNLEKTAKRLLLIREGVNLACLMADAGKRMEIHALALAVAAGFLIPPAAVIIEAALYLCWSFAESVLDVRELFHGGHVPLVKNSDDWQLSLENLPNLLDGLDSQRRDSAGGMSYEDYLQIMLLTRSKQEKLQRGMDMTELSIRELSGYENFRLDCCIEAAEISVDVEANSKKIFTVTKQYSYT